MSGALFADRNARWSRRPKPDHLFFMQPSLLPEIKKAGVG
jgi:hypothetical protein